MVNIMKILKTDALLSNLDEVLDFVNASLDEADCPVKTKISIDIAVEEIFVNIAHYAYGENVGWAQIETESDGDRTLKITFKDGGTPYNPLAKPDPDITESAQERRIGGLGIYMVKKSMDEVSYEYKDGMNVFTIRKKI